MSKLINVEERNEELKRIEEAFISGLWGVYLKNPYIGELYKDDPLKYVL